VVGREDMIVPCMASPRNPDEAVQFDMAGGAALVAGLSRIAVGFALAVLPGPLTIPPVLLRDWISSTEFALEERFFDSFKDRPKARGRTPGSTGSSAAVTLGGLALAGVAFWAVRHLELVDKAQAAIGM
jgi:hypothetical protein